MAAKYWPGMDPIGRQVGVANTKWPLRTIVGVVEDVKHYSLKEVPAPEMYVPYAQNEIRIWPPMRTLQAAVRSEASPEAILSGVKRALVSSRGCGWRRISWHRTDRRPGSSSWPSS